MKKALDGNGLCKVIYATIRNLLKRILGSHGEKLSLFFSGCESRTSRLLLKPENPKSHGVSPFFVNTFYFRIRVLSPME